METAEFRQAAERAAPGSLLGETALAGAEIPCFAVRATALVPVARAWRDLPGAGLPWLEAVLARDMGRELCLTYVLRAPAGRRQAALRVTVPLPAGKPARAPSLADLFESGAHLEREISERFDVWFEGAARVEKADESGAPGFYRKREGRGGTA